MNFATTLWMLLFVWMVDAAKFGDEEVKRITTSRTSGNVTIEAHHHRNAWPKMDKVDKRNLVKRDCGLRPKISKVKDAIRKFGPNAVFTAKTSSGGDTCLHYAASYGNDHIIELLAEKGLKKFDPKDNNRETPLRIAIRRRKYSTITTLIKLGADLEKAKESNLLKDYFEKMLKDEETRLYIEKGRSYLGERVSLSATEYHSDADYNSMRVGVVIVVHTFKNGLIFECLDQFASYLEGS